MPDRPLILRSRPCAVPKPTPAEMVARNIRYELGSKRLGPSFLAQVTGVSAQRARHLYHGRRDATATELLAIANALQIAPALLLEVNHG